MYKRSLVKALGGVSLVCIFVLALYKGYDYKQKKEILKDAYIQAFKFNFKNNKENMPIRDKKSGENLKQCAHMLNVAIEDNSIDSSRACFYYEYLCNQYVNKKLNYGIWIDVDNKDQYGYSHVMTTENSHMDLTKKLNISK